MCIHGGAIQVDLRVFTNGHREGQKGCFAVSSMREFPILPPDAVDIVTRSRNRLKQLIAKKIEAEHPNMDADSLAEISPDFLSGSVWSITSVRADALSSAKSRI